MCADITGKCLDKDADERAREREPLGVVITEYTLGGPSQSPFSFSELFSSEIYSINVNMAASG